MSWAILARVALLSSLSVTGIYLALLTLLLLVAMQRAGRERARQKASAAIRPSIDNALVEYLAGGKDDEYLRKIVATHANDVSEAILLFQTTVGGSARDRLCGLALDLGLVRQWCEQSARGGIVARRKAHTHLAFACAYEPCRRVAGDTMRKALTDRDEEIRLAACRAALLAGGDEAIHGLFELAIQPNLLTRVVLTEDLRRYALELAEGPIRAALNSGEAQRIRGTLEILVAWERALPVGDLRALLEHRDREIRVLAFKLAAFVPVGFEGRLAMIRSLHDPDEGIRGLAIFAVGRQKLAEAIPDLARCLRSEGLEQARRAAAALAAMPPLGWSALEELSGSSNLVTALAAGEALARARTEV